MVSIIVPVYNTAKYLEKTIQSIILQTNSDWEIILIDDGSTDNSLELCNKIASQNEKIRVFHKKNGGLASARNAGIKLARGKYLSFVDSDDEISENFIETMVDEMETSGCDIVFCGLRRICETNILQQLYENASYNCDQYYIASYDSNKFKTRSCCTALYKKDIIKGNHLFFLNKLMCGEDSVFVPKYISFCRAGIRTTSKCYYDYIDQDPNSITKSIFYNHYLLDRKIYTESYRNSVDKDTFIKKTGARYIDIMIRELMRFVAYSDESLLSKLKQINIVVKDKLTQKAILYYNNQSPKHSKWIPRFIKMRFSLTTYAALKYRIKYTHYKKEHAKIKSIWRESLTENI